MTYKHISRWRCGTHDGTSKPWSRTHRSRQPRSPSLLRRPGGARRPRGTCRSQAVSRGQEAHRGQGGWRRSFPGESREGGREGQQAAVREPVGMEVLSVDTDVWVAALLAYAVHPWTRNVGVVVRKHAKAERVIRRDRRYLHRRA
ncbi:unnamed protein product [Scytosiphon promiscuus]